MRVTNVRPVGVIVEAEHRIEDLKLLKIALDNSEIKVGEKLEGSWEARNYVMDVFYPEIVKLIEEFKDVT